MKKRFAFLLLIATTAFSRQHPLTFDDLAAIHRIGAPQISPHHLSPLNSNLEPRT